MQRLPQCFVCKTTGMLDSKNGVTCGEPKCDDELPSFIKHFEGMVEGHFAGTKAKLEDKAERLEEENTDLQKRLLETEEKLSYIKKEFFEKLKKKVEELFPA